MPKINIEHSSVQRIVGANMLWSSTADILTVLSPIYGADSLASPVRRSWLEPSTVPPISGRTGVKNLPPIFLMEPSSNAARMITPDIAEIKNSQKASNVSLKSNMFVPLQEREIRLFNWTTSGKSDEVCGVLVTRSLNDDLYYDALSYVWGGTPGKNSPSIMVNGQSVLITKNLHAALRAFGLKGIKRPIWIDSVCINQKDKEERLRQVKSMGEIYRRAANVHIWLGEVEGFTKEPTYHIGTDYLRRFLNELSALVSDKDMISTPFYRITRVPIGDYSADRLIKRMTTSDWFSRMWVIQESAFAQNTTMHFGVWSCSWMAGEEAVRFLRRLKFASACPDWDIIIQSRSVGSRRVRYSAGSWYSPMINLLEVSVLNYYGSRPPPDLLDLLYETREKESADPRDRIFGLLEFSAAQCCTPLEIDHNLDESAIWDRILAHLKTCKDHLPI